MNEQVAFLRENHVPQPERLIMLIGKLAVWVDEVCSSILGWDLGIDMITPYLVMEDDTHVKLTIHPEFWGPDSHVMFRAYLHEEWWLPTEIRVEASHVRLSKQSHLRAAMKLISEAPPDESDDSVRWISLPYCPDDSYQHGMEALSAALGIPPET